MLFAEPEDVPGEQEIGVRALAVAALVPREFGAAYPHDVRADMTLDRTVNAVAGLILGLDRRMNWIRLANSAQLWKLREKLIEATAFGQLLPTADRWNVLKSVLLAAERHGLPRRISDAAD
jgi:hypothetical protein